MAQVITTPVLMTHIITTLAIKRPDKMTQVELTQDVLTQVVLTQVVLT